MDVAGSLITGRGATREYEMGARRKEPVRSTAKHQRQWATWVRQGKIPDDGNNDLFADWEADSKVSDLLIAHWVTTVLRAVHVPPS